MIRLLAIVCAPALSVTGAVAQSVKPASPEIATLLTGNTAAGQWQGTNYRRYFKADGTTIYAQEGSRSTLGEWRIDAARDEYQSILPRDAGREGWFVMECPGTCFRVSKATPPTPFEVVQGEQPVPPSE